MEDVVFEEDPTSYRDTTDKVEEILVIPGRPTGALAWMVKANIVKDTRQARFIVLVASALILLIIVVVLVIVFHKSVTKERVPLPIQGVPFGSQ